MGIIRHGGDTVYSEQFQCPICGKIAFRNAAWAYKRKYYVSKNKQITSYFCSYGCMRKFDKAEEGKKTS